MKLDPYFTPYISLFKIDQKPKVRAKTIKILRDNIEEKFHDIGFGKDCFYVYNNKLYT